MTTKLKEPMNEYYFTLKPAAAENVEYGKKRMQEIRMDFCIIDYWTSIKTTCTEIFFESTMAAIKRGVNFRIITTSPEKGEAVPEKIQTLIKMGVKMRFISTPLLGAFMIADHDFIRFYLEKSRITTFGPSIEANNNYIVSVLKDYFELLWSKAVEYRT